MFPRIENYYKVTVTSIADYIKKNKSEKVEKRLVKNKEETDNMNKSSIM